MKGILLPLVAMASCVAQFTSLRTDYLGSQVFFVSTLNYRGQAPAQGGKLYSADDRGVHLINTVPRAWITYEGFPPSFGVSNYYDVIDIDRSSNGLATAVTRQRECAFSGSICYNDQRFTTVYDEQGQEIAAEIGPGRISRNGEWVSLGDYRISLRTGERRYTGSWQAIADNGTMMIFGGPSISPEPAIVVFLRADGYRYELSERGTQGVINSDGTVGAWVSDGQVRRVDLKPYTPQTVTVGEGTEPKLSDDGSRLTFLNNRQIWLAEGSTSRQMTKEMGGISTATLSGDGRIVYYVTGRGELKRMNLLTGDSKALIGPSTAFLDRQIITSAGSATLLRASVHQGQQVNATLRGLQVPIIKVEDNQLYIQVPWDTPQYNYYPLTLEAGGNQDWTGASISLGIVNAAPRFFPDPTGRYPLAAHGDFHGLITPDDPAVPGEIVHLYAAGLGQVTPTVPTGAPSPVAPLAEVPRSFPICYTNLNTMDVLWVGLAPGTIGIYQLDFRVPPNAKGNTLDVWCRGDDLGARSLMPLRAVQ